MPLPLAWLAPEWVLGDLPEGAACRHLLEGLGESLEQHLLVARVQAHVVHAPLLGP